jgi:hypothetical protein
MLGDDSMAGWMEWYLAGAMGEREARRRCEGVAEELRGPSLSRTRVYL